MGDLVCNQRPDSVIFSQIGKYGRPARNSNKFHSAHPDRFFLYLLCLIPVRARMHIDLQSNRKICGMMHLLS